MRVARRKNERVFAVVLSDSVVKNEQDRKQKGKTAEERNSEF